MDFKFVPVIEEQMSVKFTGKVNLLSPFNHQYLGHLLFKDGMLIDVRYQQLSGLRAFYQLGIREYNLEKHLYVVEPEVVAEEEQRIHYPISVLLTKLRNQIKIYDIVHRQRPPENVKILVKADSVGEDFECTAEEFRVLTVLTETNDVNSIYGNCSLLEHEITSALINLRKKGVLTIVGRK